MATKKPWELGWGTDSAEQEDTQAVPMQQPAPQNMPSPQPTSGAKPWEMDWGNGTPDAQPQQPESSWGLYNSDDGSIMDTIASGAKRLGTNTLAAFVDESKNASNYALKRAKTASAEFREDNEKLGTAGQLVAGAGMYAPVAALGAVNPWLGGAAMAGATTGESLAAQQENNQDYNIQDAAASGLAAGAFDMATAGLAGRGVNLAQKLSRPVAREAAGLGANVAQGSASNTFSMAATNMASGRPWDENLGEAAAMGGLGSGAVHGAMRGFSAGMKLPINKGGESAIRRNVENDQAGLGASQGFRDQDINYQNEMYRFHEDLANAPAGENIRPAIEDYVEVALNNSTPTAVGDVLNAFHKNGVPLTPQALNFEVTPGIGRGESRNLAQEHGYDTQDAARMGANINELKLPNYVGRQKQIDAGMYKEAQQKLMKDGYNETLAGWMQPLKENKQLLMERIGQLEAGGYGREASRIRNALNGMEGLEKMANDFGGGSRKTPPTADEIRPLVTSLLDDLHSTRMFGDMKGFNGNQFDPIGLLNNVNMTHKMAQSMWPGIRDGNPDPLAAAARSNKISGADVAIDAALMASGVAPLKTLSTAVRHGHEVSSRRKNYVKSLAEGQSIYERWAGDRRGQAAQQRVDSEMESGNFEGAAQRSAEALEEDGISVGGAHEPLATPEAPQTAPEPMPVQPEPTMAPEPEVAPQAPTERPDLTGRGVRDAEAAAAAQRQAEAESAQQIDPEVAAQQRAAMEARLAEDARIAAQRERDANVQPEPAQEVVTPEPQRGNADRDLTADAARYDSSRRAPEPEPEAAPVREEPEAEPAPAKEETREETPKEADEARKEKAMLPIERRIKKHEETPTKRLTSDDEVKYQNDKNKRDKIEAAVNAHAGSKNNEFTTGDIYDAIEMFGGPDKLWETSKGREQGVKTVLPDVLDAYSKEMTKRAEANAKRAEQISDDEISTISTEKREEALAETRRRMKFEKIDDDIVDKAFTQAAEIDKNFGPKDVFTLARKLSQEKVSAAKKREREADRNAGNGKGKKVSAEKANRKTMQESRDWLQDYANNLNEGLSNSPEIRKIIYDATASSDMKVDGLKPTQEGKAMVKINDYINKQHDLYEAALKRAHTDAPEREAEFRAMRDKFGQYKKNISGAEEKYNAKVKEHQDKIAKAKEADEKVREASDEVKKAESQNAAIEKAAKKAPTDQPTSAEIKERIEDAVGKEFGEMAPAELQFLVDRMVHRIPANIKGTSDPKFAKYDAILEVAGQALKEAGRVPQAKATVATRKALRSALERKEAMPDKRDYWLGTDERDAIADNLNSDSSGVNSFYGRMYQKLRSAVFADEQSTKHVRYPAEVLDEAMKARSTDAGKDGLDSVEVKVKTKKS